MTNQTLPKGIIPIKEIDSATGAIMYRLQNGNRHREDGPAIEWASGDKWWYSHGKLHREDGPAVEYASGDKLWYSNGERHRLNGPAVEYANGTRWWFLDGNQFSEKDFNEKIKMIPIKEIDSEGTIRYMLPNGELHREDGPAIEYLNGHKEWYLNGKLHRLDGSAVEYTNGSKSWHINGELHRENGPAIEWASGDKYWLLNGNFHREDGPAVEFSNGTKKWYLNGRRHREDGPAIIYSKGTKEWHINGKLHRVDGPAIEYPNGYKSWFINGIELSEKDFNEKIKMIPIKEIDRYGTITYRLPNGDLHKDGGPAVEYSNGSKEWALNGHLHREDGPAVELANGTKKWFLNGKCHRLDGPAIEYPSGDKIWFINGDRKFEMNSQSQSNVKDPISPKNLKWYIGLTLLGMGLDLNKDNKVQKEHNKKESLLFVKDTSKAKVSNG